MALFFSWIESKKYVHRNIYLNANTNLDVNQLVSFKALKYPEEFLAIKVDI